MPSERARAVARNGANTPWTMDELRHSVEIYILLLRLQELGSEEKFEPAAQFLLENQLRLRNNAAIRYRMRNISAVVKELGAPTLRDFSPAESVGANVRARIRSLLLEHSDFLSQLDRSFAQSTGRQDVALAALRMLREQIQVLEIEFSWVGHNNPPRSNDRQLLSREDFRDALEDIHILETELMGPTPNSARVVESNSRLLNLGSKIIRWIGARSTKFLDAALLASAPLVVAQISGVLPPLINALEAVTKVIGQ